MDLLRVSLAIAVAAGDPTEVPRAHANLGTLLEMGGLVDEALDESLAGVEAIRLYGSDIGFATFLAVNTASMLIELGRYADAAELLERQVVRALPGVITIYVHVALTHLAVRTGDLAAAREHLAIASREAARIEDAQFVIDIHSFGTEIALWEGDPTTALSIAREGLDRVSEMDDAVILGELAIPAVRAAADLAVRSRAARDPADAELAVQAGRDIIDRYRASTRRLTDLDVLAAHEIGWRMQLCEAELARAIGADDPALWEAVRPALIARPAPFLEAYVLWRAAEARAASGDIAGAAIPLREGHGIATRIGAARLTAAMEGLARRLRVDLATRATTVVGATATEVDGAAAPTGGAGPAQPGDPFGLTSREREVLALVAEGYTNRRIADTLFISESTAGVHVSHILGKLGVDTRTEAAAIAVRLGLDRPVAPA